MSDEDKKEGVDAFVEKMEMLGEDVDVLDNGISNEFTERLTESGTIDDTEIPEETADRGDDWEDFKQEVEDFGGDTRGQMNLYRGGTNEDVGNDGKSSM